MTCSRHYHTCKTAEAKSTNIVQPSSGHMSMRSDMYDMELPTTQGGRSLLLRRCLGIAGRSGAFQLSGLPSPFVL